MIVTPVAKVPSALRKSRESNPSPAVLRTGAAWLPGASCSMAGSSEGRVGWQPERHPAIDRTVDVPVQHVVCIRRVDVAECPLDRVSFVDCTTAGRGEEQ